MAQITKKQFLEDVMHEIKMLKSNATKNEKDRLDYSRFSPRYPESCIYGQMTGNCSNIRANDLMDVSCTRVFDAEEHGKDGVSILIDSGFTQAKKFINGKYKGQTWEDGRREYKYLSALEGYICLKGANTEEIIQFIKGERKTLTLK